MNKVIILICMLIFVIGCSKDKYLECNESNYPELRKVSTIPEELTFYRVEGNWCCIREPSEIYGSCMERKEANTDIPTNKNLQS